MSTSLFPNGKLIVINHSTGKMILTLLDEKYQHDLDSGIAFAQQSGENIAHDPGEGENNESV